MPRAAVKKVAFWELEPNDAEQASVVPHPVEPCIRSSGVTDIGIFPEDEDGRVPVDQADLQPGGKYYSIVKLFIRHNDSETWTTATGWLCRDNLVITAAHCVLNGGQHAECVRVHVGYSASGEGSGHSSADQRSVTCIALPSAWSGSKAEQSDMAFLQLDRPFQGVAPLGFDTTQTKAQHELTIVGYPADLGARTGSPGGEMHHIKVRREINLERTRWNMLMYQGDTQGGLSGAPIIRESDFVAIGTHVRGGSFNFGAVIGGPFGVDIHMYEEALRMLGEARHADSVSTVETDTDRQWLKYVLIL